MGLIEFRSTFVPRRTLAHLPTRWTSSGPVRRSANWLERLSAARFASDELAAEDGALSRALVGKIYGALFIASGIVTATSPLLPTEEAINRAGVIAIGVIALVMGTITLFLPWRRWPRAATLALVPFSFVLIAFHNYFGGSDPYRFPLFFMVVFVGLGIGHRQGISTAMLPPFTAAYLAPFFLSGNYSWGAISSVFYTGPVCVLAGETLAWVCERLRRARNDLGQSEARFRSLVQHASDIIIVLDEDGTITYVSPSGRQAGIAVGRRDVIGTHAHTWLHMDDVVLFQSFLQSCLTDPDHVSRAEIRYRSGSSEFRFMEIIGSNLLAEPSVRGIVITAHDVHDRKTLEQQLSHQAFHDPLTNLANRALFLDRLGHAIDGAAYRSRKVGVLFIDVDHFKLVNDSLGHRTGDRLLVEIGSRLRHCVSPASTVARLGGDEFAILLEDIADLHESVRVAERILERFAVPVILDGREVFVNVSIGLAISDGSSVLGPESILRNADVAMYRAKSRGKGCYQIFDPAMIDHVRERLELENDLRRAVEREEFLTVYQSEVSVATGDIKAREALVRWQHPTRGIVSPSVFIPIAEETGLILSIGEIVLRRACAQLISWRQTGTCDPSMMISVNLSARQIQARDIVERVAAILDEHQLEPGSLVLEITESAVMENIPVTVATLTELKRLGVRLAIDDFGTGYSSLSYLKQFPVDFVKLDRSFIAGIATDAQDNAIVEAIIRVVHSLGGQVIAEGVETTDQLAKLGCLGCDLAQGYLFDRPTDPYEA